MRGPQQHPLVSPLTFREDLLQGLGAPSGAGVLRGVAQIRVLPRGALGTSRKPQEAGEGAAESAGPPAS